jgi:hypothetical protein
MGLVSDDLMNGRDEDDVVRVSNPETGESVRLRSRQLSMLARHTEMDEHRALVEGAVRDLAGELPTGAEISLGVKIPYVLVAANDELFDAKFQMKLDVKPHVEKD